MNHLDDRVRNRGPIQVSKHQAWNRHPDVGDGVDASAQRQRRISRDAVEGLHRNERDRGSVEGVLEDYGFGIGDAQIAGVADSVFDHSDDIEFVLDPVMLKRGRAAVTRPGPGEIRTEQAVVSF